MSDILHWHVRRHGLRLDRDRPGHLLHHDDLLLELILSRHVRDVELAHLSGELRHSQAMRVSRG